MSIAKFSSFFSSSFLKKLVFAGILEFGPIILFVISYEHFHIYRATCILMLATIVSTIIIYRFQKRLPFIALYIAFLTIIFGFLTISHREPKFIQIRDTLYDVIFALTLIIGLIRSRSFLRMSFNSVLPMTIQAWDRITYSWILFFLCVALANEYIRRTMELSQWFHFKAGMILITILFGIITLFLFYEKEKKIAPSN